jgi:DNA polymerase-3 subunit chi
MTEIRFYHLQTTGLDRALPAILEKALGTGKRIIVKTPDKNSCDRLNEHLWSFKPDSFLPHGSAADGYSADQPIFLTMEDDNPNGAEILVLTGGSTSPHVGDFDLCCEMLDGNNAEAVKDARARWKEYKEAGYELTYWLQDETGRWQKKEA